MLPQLLELAYQRGWLTAATPTLPVVSVGNITVGGTGKTPVTQAIARYCLQRGLRPGIVLRGYRRRSRGALLVSFGNGPQVEWQQCGDEAWLHAWKLPQAIVAVHRRREIAATLAQQAGANIIAADDCFQYRRLRRHLELVLVDRRTLYGRLLPFGPLREPRSALKRAHILLLNGVEPYELPPFVQELPWVRVEFRSAEIQQWTLAGPSLLPGPLPEPVAAFAGIAYPERFRDSLLTTGWRIGLWLPFPDHHPYSPRDLWHLFARCQRLSLRWAVTTEKDAVRLWPLLSEFAAAGVTLITVAVTAEFGQGAEHLWTSLDRLLQQLRRQTEDVAEHLKR